MKCVVEMCKNDAAKVRAFEITSKYNTTILLRFVFLQLRY